MSTIIETELKEVLTQINGKLDKLTSNVNQLEVSVTKDINELKISMAEDINELKISMAEDINELKVTVAKLEEGQNGVKKRLDNLDFIARTVIGGVVLALLAGLAKILYPNLMS